MNFTICESTMLLNPAFELPKETTKSFDRTLCLFCQKKVVEKRKSSRGRPLQITVDDFQEFITTCRGHFENETAKYMELHEEIKEKTGDQLKLEGYCFHSDCRRQFNRDKILITRKRKVEEKKEHEERMKQMRPTRVLRMDTEEFDFTKCLFCQKDNHLDLHDVTQDSRDFELKRAFEECPISLQLYRIRSLVAHDAMAGELRYHTDCWTTIIYRRQPEITTVTESSANISCESDIFLSPSSDNLANESDSMLLSPSADGGVEEGSSSCFNFDTNIQEIVITEVMRGVELALHDNQVLNVRNVVEVYQSRMKEYGLVETRDYKSLRKMIVRAINKYIPDVSLDLSVPNESQRITSKNMEKLILRLTEENCTKGEEVGLLKRAANVLRKRTLQFMNENPVNFKGSVESEYKNCPELLFTFVKWLLAGDRALNESVDEKVENSSRTTAFNIMYNMKTKRQASYKPKHSNGVQPRHSYVPVHQIGIGLCLRHFDRNNNVIRLISMFGYSIPDRQCLRWGTAIANSMIDNMLSNDNVYIPPNLVKDVLPMFHIDNIDWLEDTPDGKNTTHMLMICIFQRKICDPIPLSLNLDQKTVSLTLKENSFAELLSCNKPSKSKFVRTSGCSSFSISNAFDENKGIWKDWLAIRSLERLFLKDNLMVWCSKFISRNETEMTILHDESATSEGEEISEEPDTATCNTNMWEALDKLVLPSFGATNSLVCNADVGITNIFSVPLVPGPASSWSALLTSLMRAKKVTAWACGNASKTVVSLDLDLYEKIYLLVNTNKDLRNRYVLCLGELHAVFAHLRAIGNFINGLGIGDAWMAAGWYDSPCLVRQVLECNNMKRATRAHESTVIAISVYILRVFLSQCDEQIEDNLLAIRNIITTAASSINSKETESLRDIWEKLVKELHNIQLEHKMTEFLTKKENNQLLQIYVIYMNMVERLFNFIEASRNRNWLLHLHAAQELMQDFASMDRIKYRRLWAVYIADMLKLEKDDPEIWKSFMEGNFSCQKTDIPGTALGRDHAGEQMNKVLKTRGGLTGITRNDNSRTRHLLLAPVLQSISDEMLKIGGSNSSKSKTHHEQSISHTNRQNNSVSSLLEVFSSQGLTFESDDEQLRNIVTGQIFPDEVYQDMFNSEKKGKVLYEKFVADRLQPDSEVEIFAPLKKAKVKTCKDVNKSRKVTVNDRVVELRSNCNLFARCAVIKGKRDIDMKIVVGDYELMAVPRSLMTADGKLIPGHNGKSELTKEIMAQCGEVTTETLSLRSDSRTCVVIDAMYVVNTIIPKPSWVATGDDLAKEFLNRVDNRSKNAETVAIVFDTYREISLKCATRDDRVEKGKNKKAPRKFQINSTTNIKKVSMSELLGSNETKRSLTIFLMEKSINHLQQRNVKFAVAGNGITFSSFQDPFSNNHEEADTLIINTLCILQPTDEIIAVHSVDTDVFTLLLRHCEKIPCQKLYMKLVSGFADLTSIYESLGQTVSTALLTLHVLTGCDTTGKFAGISKQVWTKRFMVESVNERFVNAMVTLEDGVNDEILTMFASFVCKAYRFPRATKKVNDEVHDLSSTRYHLFRKSGAEGEKLPPSSGAFLMHVKRGYSQLCTWSCAHLSIIDEPDLTKCGWDKQDNQYIPIPNSDPVAPEAVIEMISCNSCKLCSDGRCPCRQSKQTCTDFCGCGEYCENTDSPIPGNVMEDDVEEDVDK